MKPDASLDGFGVLRAVDASEKIAEEISDQRLRRAVRKKKMCQVVHYGRGLRARR
jgi:hypothetical protein